MACVLKHFITQGYVVAADVPFNSVEHRIGKSIKITLRCVEVTYTVNDGGALFGFLRRMYTDTRYFIQRKLVCWW